MHFQANEVRQIFGRTIEQIICIICNAEICSRILTCLMSAAYQDFLYLVL